MNIEQIKEKLVKKIAPWRYDHTMGVVETTLHWAQKFNVDLDKAEQAALLHDCAKDYSDAELLAVAKKHQMPVDFIHQKLPTMLHGPVGAIVAQQEYDIIDEEVLAAIKVHTLGSENMSDLAKILMIADSIEPGRKYPEAEELRQLLAKEEGNITRCALICIECKIRSVLKSKYLLHPKAIDVRNSLLLKLQDEDGNSPEKN